MRRAGRLSRHVNTLRTAADARGYAAGAEADSGGGLLKTGFYIGVTSAAIAAAASFSDYPKISEVSFAASSAFMPVLRLLDGETAHRVSVLAAAYGLTPRERRPDDPILQTTLWGKTLSNPIGLAAGFDKNAEAIDGLFDLGFGIVEIGSVTPKPQPGNPQPRVFRLPEAGAVINRYGFNCDGAPTVAERLLERRRLQLLSGAPENGGVGRLLGVNLGKNKTTEDAAADYESGLRSLGRFADYLVVNVSSPNTPGLRALQSRAELENLLKRVLAARASVDWGGLPPPPLVLKIAPDLTPEDMKDIAAVALRLKLDGLIVSNTTVERPDSIRGLAHATESGGLSGRPLFRPSTEVLREMYRLTGGTVPLIGAGGVASGAEAYAKVRAGASAVQLYTGMVYGGAALVPRIKEELAAHLRLDGFKSVAEAVGADHRQPAAAAAGKKGAAGAPPPPPAAAKKK